MSHLVKTYAVCKFSYFRLLCLELNEPELPLAFIQSVIPRSADASSQICKKKKKKKKKKLSNMPVLQNRNCSEQTVRLIRAFAAYICVYRLRYIGMHNQRKQH